MSNPAKHSTLVISNLNGSGVLTQEFHLSVTPIGADEYLIRTERVAPGVPLAAQQVNWPIQDWFTQLESLTSDTARQLGQQLYDALFPSAIRESWAIAQTQAQTEQTLLHLRLGLRGTRLPLLPWELLCLDAHYLVLQPGIVLTRYQPYTALAPERTTAPTTPCRTLRILWPIPGEATDADACLRARVEQLARPIEPDNPHDQNEQIGLIPLSCRSLAVDVQGLKQPDGDALRPILQQGAYQIWHDSGALEAHLGDSIDRRELATLLVQQGVQLVIRTALCSPEWVTGLLQQEIQAVVVIGAEDPDRVTSLVLSLYQGLQQGYPLSWSISQARREAMKVRPESLPSDIVGYLQPEWDGYLRSVAPIALDSPTAPWLEAELDGFLDDLEAMDEAEYEEDSAIVADLFRELAETEPETPRLAENGVQAEAVTEPPQRDHPGRSSDAVISPPVLSPVPAENQDSAAPILEAELQRSPAEKNNQVTPARSRLPARVRLMAAIGLAGIAGGFAIWLGVAQMNRVAVVSNHPVNPERTPLPEPPSFNPEKLTQTALTQFQQGNWREGEQIITLLLDHQALDEAEQVLKALPTLPGDPTLEADLDFLQGRLIWQRIHQGAPNYRLQTVQQYWERAARKAPTVPEYHIALGFAYYAGHQLSQAERAWFQALFLLEERKLSAQRESSTVAGQAYGGPTITVKTSFEPQEMLTAYAGMALVLAQSAAGKPAAKRTNLLGRASELYLKVITDNPTQFQPETLQHNWLWPDRAVKDWQTLGRQQTVSRPGNQP